MLNTPWGRAYRIAERAYHLANEGGPYPAGVSQTTYDLSNYTAVNPACGSPGFPAFAGWPAGCPAFVAVDKTQVGHAGPQPRPSSVWMWQQNLGDYPPNPDFDMLVPGQRFARISPTGNPFAVVPGFRRYAETPWTFIDPLPYKYQTYQRPRLRRQEDEEPLVRPQPRPRHHRQRPPPPRTRERKGRAARGVAAAAAAAFGVTEAIDFVDALFDALPENIQATAPRSGRVNPNGRNPGMRYSTPIDRARHIYNNINALNLGQAIGNVIANQIEDRIIGALNSGADRTRRRAGGTGWGFAT